MSINLNTPFSLYSIPVVYATAFYPHFVKFRMIDSSVGFNNLKPRENGRDVLEKKGLPKHVVERAERLAAAHQNGNEIFPLWAAAVLAANYAGVPDRTLNIASAAFISLRILFNFIYANQKSVSVSWTRTATFFTGLGVPIYILIKAANKLRVGPNGGF